VSKCSSSCKLRQVELFPELAPKKVLAPNDGAVSETNVDQLRKLTKPVMVQIAPGQWAPVKGARAPDMSIVYWVQNPDGTFTPSPVTGRFVRVTGKLVRQLGFAGKYNTLYRLGRAGFIEMIKIAPSTIWLNLDSFYNHLRRCAENPFLWDRDGAAVKEYRRSI
jgi:hypothetical protein